MDSPAGYVDRGISDIFVYVDGRGNHGLCTVNQDSPILVLAFCVFEKCASDQNVVPQAWKLKVRCFRTDIVVPRGPEICRAGTRLNIPLNGHFCTGCLAERLGWVFVHKQTTSAALRLADRVRLYLDTQEAISPFQFKKEQPHRLKAAGP